MQKFLSVIDYVLKVFVVILIAAISVLGFYQVITRHLFNDASTWSEEAIRFLFVWASCVGGALGIKENIHIGIDVIVNRFSNRIQAYARVVVLGLIAVFGLFLILYGFKLTMMTANQKSPALGLPMSYVYFAIPVLGVLSVYYSIIEAIRTIQLARS